MPSRCPACHGTRSEDCLPCGTTGESPHTGRTCQQCRGRGWIPCGVCDGTGEINPEDDPPAEAWEEMP